MKMNLAWNDNASDESSQSIYISDNVSGPFGLLKTVEPNITTTEITVPSNLESNPIYLSMTASNDFGESAHSKVVPALPNVMGNFPTQQYLKMRAHLLEEGKEMTKKSFTQGTLGIDPYLYEGALQEDGRILTVSYDGTRLFDPNTKTFTDVPDAFLDETGALGNYTAVKSPDGKVYTLLNWVFREHTPTGWREVATISPEQQAMFTPGQQGFDQFSFGMLADGDLFYIFRTSVDDSYVAARVNIALGTVVVRSFFIPLGFKTNAAKNYRVLPNGNIMLLTGRSGQSYYWYILELNPADTDSPLVFNYSIVNIYSPVPPEVVGDKLVFCARKESGSYDPAHLWIVPYVSGQPIDFTNTGVREDRLWNAKEAFVLYDGRVVYSVATSPTAQGASLIAVNPKTGAVEEYLPDEVDPSFNNFKPSYRMRCKNGVICLDSSGRWRHYELDEPEGLEMGILNAVVV